MMCMVCKQMLSIENESLRMRVQDLEGQMQTCLIEAENTRNLFKSEMSIIAVCDETFVFHHSLSVRQSFTGRKPTIAKNKCMVEQRERKYPGVYVETTHIYIHFLQHKHQKLVNRVTRSLVCWVLE